MINDKSAHDKEDVMEHSRCRILTDDLTIIIKSQSKRMNVFWYQLIWVVLDKVALNRYCCHDHLVHLPIEYNILYFLLTYLVSTYLIAEVL